MKVLSGSAKGRKLKFPKLAKGERLRPLMGRVKGALFNILMSRIEGSVFLDLFAGTGSVGIEALSRGAKFAAFVEMNRKIADVLRENLEMTGFSGRSEIYCLEAAKAVGVLDRSGAKFDVIFIGAPYRSPDLIGALKAIGDSTVVPEGGIVIAEHNKKSDVADSYGGLKRYRDSGYGDTVLTFYKLEKGSK